MAIKQRIKPDADSHFRLLPCKCGGEAEYIGFDTGMWAVGCSVCGKRTLLDPVRHRVQVTWNSEVRHGKICGVA